MPERDIKLPSHNFNHLPYTSTMPERYIKLPNHNWLPSVDHYVDRNDLSPQQLFKRGREITFDGGRWGVIREVVGHLIWVTDEDGGEHELIEGRID